MFLLLQLVVTLQCTPSRLAVQGLHFQSYLKLPNLYLGNAMCIPVFMLWRDSHLDHARRAFSRCLVSEVPPICPAVAGAQPLDGRPPSPHLLPLEGPGNSLT